MIQQDGKYWVSLPTALLSSALLFLIGGYWGDALASSDLIKNIQINTANMDKVRERTAVIDNRLLNIEAIVIEIKTDLKELKNERNK